MTAIFTCTDFAANKPIRFDIIDGRTGQKVGEAKTRAAASRAVDRRDNAYGACRYSARAIWA